MDAIGIDFKKTGFPQKLLLADMYLLCQVDRIDKISSIALGQVSCHRGFCRAAEGGQFTVPGYITVCKKRYRCMTEL